MFVGVFFGMRVGVSSRHSYRFVAIDVAHEQGCRSFEAKEPRLISCEDLHTLE